MEFPSLNDTSIYSHSALDCRSCNDLCETFISGTKVIARSRWTCILVCVRFAKTWLNEKSKRHRNSVCKFDSAFDVQRGRLVGRRRCVPTAGDNGWSIAPPAERMRSIRVEFIVGMATVRPIQPHRAPSACVSHRFRLEKLHSTMHALTRRRCRRRRRALMRTIFRMRATQERMLCACTLHCTMYTTNGNPKHKPTNRTNS